MTQLLKDLHRSVFCNIYIHCTLVKKEYTFIRKISTSDARVFFAFILHTQLLLQICMKEGGSGSRPSFNISQPFMLMPSYLFILPASV